MTKATLRSILVVLTGSVLFIASCRRSDQSTEQRNTAAEKAGKVAYSMAKQTEKAAKVVGKKMAEAAKDAHKGWKEAAREDKKKDR